MSIRGSNFENQHPFASDHALVWEHCMPDGILYGVDMSFTSALFTLGPGFMLVAGRMFEITAAENISISPGSGYARVYVAIDTGGTSTENSFNQVSFGVDYAATLEAFTELTQNEININQGAAVYQAEVAVLSITNSGVTAIERQMELVEPGVGPGSNVFAVIGVSYPTGSVVTVTDGEKTFTAKDTSGQAVFIIPYAGTWTVTVTDGTNTKSQNVSITTEGQFASVELSYSIQIVSNGILKMPMSVYSARYESGSASSGNNVSVTQENGYVVVAGNQSGYGMAYIETAFDDKSEIILEGDFMTESSNERYCRLVIWSEIGPYISSNVIAYQSYSATEARLPVPEGIERGKSYYVGITTVYTHQQKITRFEIV